MKKLCLLLLMAGTVLPLWGKVDLPRSYNWERAEEFAPGVRYMKMSLTQPRRMKLAAVRIDLTRPEYKFILTGRDPDWGRPMPDYDKPDYLIHTRRETCRSFMERNIRNGESPVVAVNGMGWGPWCPPWNHKYAKPHGLLISNGVLVSPRKRNPSFVVYKDGRIDLRVISSDKEIPEILHAFSGFRFVLKDGVPCSGDKALAPRTGFGLSKDGRYLYFFVIDGRQISYSMGCSTYEVGQFLKFLGAHKGLNMDGGGSTTLLIRKNRKIVKLNRHRNGAERTVSATLLLCFKREGDQSKQPPSGK